MSAWIDENGYWHETTDAAAADAGVTTKNPDPNAGGRTGPMPTTTDAGQSTTPGSWWGRFVETPAQPGSGTTATTTDPGTGGGAPSGRPSGGIMDWGAQFHAPTWTPPDKFTYADFQAPTQDEAASRPGYRFAADEGKKAVETSQAAQGLYRTGGSLKDLYAWADKFATQNYNNVYGQDLTTYGTNRSNAAQNWLTNYNMSRDAFDRTYQGALDEFRPQNQYSLLDFARQWDAYKAQLDAQTALLGAGQ